MSQFSQPNFNQPIQMLPPPQKEQNAIGLTGFIVSLVGLFLCGIPSVIGLVISAIGLRKEPRGFALAGLLISLVGLIEMVGFGFLVYLTYSVTNEGMGVVQKIVVTAQLNQEAKWIGEEWETLERIPTQEEGDDLVAGKRDPNGNSIAYETDGVTFSLRAAGRDGVHQTDDDIVVGPFKDVEATQRIPDVDMGEFSDWDEIKRADDDSFNFD